MNQDESNAVSELERLVHTELSAVANVETETVLCSAPAPRKRLEQIGIPGDRDAAMLKAARSVVEAGVRTPEALAGFLDKTFPNTKVRQYSQAFWDFVGIVDPSLRGTHDWHAIYAKQDKPKRKPARKEAAPKGEYLTTKPMPIRPTQAMRDIIEALPPPHREILRDLLVNGMSMEDAAKTHGVSETAIGNVLRRGDAHIRLMLDRAPTKTVVQLEAESVSVGQSKQANFTPLSAAKPTRADSAKIEAVRQSLETAPPSQGGFRLAALTKHFGSSKLLREALLPRVDSILNDSAVKARKPTANDIQQLNKLANEFDSWEWGCGKSLIAYLGLAILCGIAIPVGAIVAIVAVAIGIAWAHARDKRFVGSPDFKSALHAVASTVLYELSLREYWSGMDWRTVEIEIASLFNKMGFKAEATPPSNDGGVDVVALKDSVKTIIQCKQHETAIGSPDVVQLVGTAKIQKADVAIMYCKSGFTSGARETARNAGVILWTLNDLVAHARKVYDV